MKMAQQSSAYGFPKKSGIPDIAPSDAEGFPKRDPITYILNP